MKRRKDFAGFAQTKKSQDAASAFDIWLSRGLHKLFDEVVNEPIPENLAKLLKEDSRKQD